MGWWDASLSPEVRALMWLPVGVELQQALVALQSSVVVAPDFRVPAVPATVSGVGRREAVSGGGSSDLVEQARVARGRGVERAGECGFPHHRPSLSEPVGVAGFPCGCQVVIAAAWTAVASWASGQADRALVQAGGVSTVRVAVSPGRADLGTLTDPAVEELAPALRASAGSARARLANARWLFSVAPLWRAVESGLVIDWHARLLLSDLRHLDLDVQREVVEQVLADLRRRRCQGWAEWTFTDLRRHAKRVAARVDRDFAARRRTARAARGVRVRYHGDGLATVSADLCDDTAARVFHRLTALAAGLDDPGDPRGVDQKRADVFTDLVLGQAFLGERVPGVGASVDPGRRLPIGTPIPVPTPTPIPSPTLSSDSVPAGPGWGDAGEVAVVIDLATLLGLAEDVAHVPGVGPIPAEAARELAADRRWRLWVTRSAGSATDVIATSPDTYRPSAAVARLVRARDPHCRMPGCRRTVTDLDHIVPFPRGKTVPENLAGLCRRHHRMKTHTRWRQDPSPSEAGDPGDTSWTWHSPAGITYHDHPDPTIG
ncbi:MAG: DUF222 domain-containing protein [Candidatus Nanopelagicales bacterium]